MFRQQNKESALTPLLCDTIEVLKTPSACKFTETAQSSWHQISNWLLHQFLIELSQTPVASFANENAGEHQFLWKALECIKRLSDAVPAIRCSVLSNKSLAQLLAPVGVQIVRNNLHSSSPALRLPLVSHLDWFVSQCSTVNR